jgi:hypothetical protein
MGCVGCRTRLQVARGRSHHLVYELAFARGVLKGMVRLLSGAPVARLIQDRETAILECARRSRVRHGMTSRSLQTPLKQMVQTRCTYPVGCSSL